VRQGLQVTLHDFDDIEVVASVSNVSALDGHTGAAPDVVVLDLHLSEEPSGPRAVRHVCDSGLPVLLLTAETEPTALLAAIDAGALGFLGKSIDGAALRAAIRAVATGECLLTPALAARMRKRQGVGRPEFPRALLEVLELVAYGLDNQAIARRRSVSVSTVKKQIRQIRDVYTSAGLKVSDRLSLQNAARELSPTGSVGHVPVAFAAR